jgi:beta-N-acetylhexosaminidase
MEPLPPYIEQLDFPSSDEQYTLFPYTSTPSKDHKEHISLLETSKTPIVSMPEVDSSPLPPSSIQTDALNNTSPPFRPAGKRLSLPAVPKTPGSPRQSQLLGDHLQILLQTTLEKIETMKTPILSKISHPNLISVATPPALPQPPPSLPTQKTHPHVGLQRSTALFLMALLCILLFRDIDQSNAQFTGPQGWASVLGGPVNASDPNLLSKLNQQIHNRTSQTGKNQTAQVTPEQFVDLIMSKMSLDQKLGQMMIVQFIGDQYSLPLSTMISQYNVGSVLIFKANNNIITGDQLKGLIQQMQENSQPIPLAMAIDQEGGAVDRLVDLDGARPSEASIGATNDPEKARQAGIQDAQDLSSYGINLNLAPVVDVTRVYNAELDTRTYGSDPTLVTQMAAAYLQGLQQSGKVIGTLKHFPGLGDVAVDPHIGVPVMRASKDQLEQVDWAPYRALIQQNLVQSVMVTHELVLSVDPNVPSTLSSKVVTGILRDDLGFQGVIMTDSLSMSGVTYYTTEYQAAADAIVAGADMVMGATSPEDVLAMFNSIKQDITNGSLSTSRIDDSVRRILLMKYHMGLLSLPSNNTK